MEPLQADIVADVEVSEADWIEATVAKGGRGNRNAVVLVAFLGVATLVAAWLAWPVRPGVWVLMPPMGVLGAFFMTRQARWTAKRAYHAVPLAWHAVRVILDEEHVRVVAESLESYRPWKHVDGWLETPRLFVLLANGAVADVWPKEAFSPEDRERLRGLLDRKLHLERPATKTEARTARTAGSVRLVLWAVLICLLIAAYVVWRSST
ncbi:MAG: YcxB family protein [Myxococcales bacterium]|nr:YcxB family protein [Myxococcales bacterium]